MSDKQPARIAPMLAADLPPEWADRVKYALSLPGNSAMGVGLSIQCVCQNGDRELHPLLLPNGGTEFATIDDLNKALELLNLYHP